jgi:HK97 family phage prohead protease
MTKPNRRRMGEVRAVTEDDDTRSVTLQCIRPNVVDDYGSLWNPHAFDASLKERLPTLAWSHDWSDPLGRGVDYKTGNDGPSVIFEFDDFDDVPTARRAFSQVRSGTITDCSVGFSNVHTREPTEDELKRFPGAVEYIERADLDEVSLVLRGAVPGAKVLAVRAVGGSVEEELVFAVARKVAAGELTEDEGKAALRLAADTDPGGEVPPTSPPDPTAVAELEQAVNDAIGIVDDL